MWTFSCAYQFCLYTSGQSLVLWPHVTNCKTDWETYFLAGWPLLAETWGWAVPCSVAQSCPTLCDPLDCSPPGSSVFQARILEWVAIFLLQGIFLTQGLNSHLLCFLHCRQILYPLSHQGSSLRDSQRQFPIIKETMNSFTKVRSHITTLPNGFLFFPEIRQGQCLKPEMANRCLFYESAKWLLELKPE